MGMGQELGYGVPCLVPGSLLVLEANNTALKKLGNGGKRNRY